MPTLTQPDDRTALLTLAMLVVVAHGVSVFGDFVYDDRFIIVNHAYLDQPAEWPRLFTEGSWAGVGLPSGNYRPLPMLTFGINHVLGRGAPFGFHLVNVVLHGLNAILLFAVGRRVLRLPAAAAWVAAALFAVHPLTAEPVAEVVGRMDLMAAAAFLGALLSHAAGRAREGRGSRGTRWFLLAAGLYAIGLLSKEHVIVFPAVALVIDRVAGVRRPLGRFAVHAAYAAVAAAYLGLRAVVFGSVLLPSRVSVIDNVLAALDAPTRIVSALKVWGMYLGHVAWPVGLAPDYGMAQILPFKSSASVGALVTWVLAAVMTIAALYLARKSPRSAVALAIVVLPFLPVSNLAFPIGTIMGDRLFYLPLAGIALLVGIGWSTLPARRRRTAQVAAVVVLGILAMGTVRQDLRWRNNVVLDRYAVTVVPNSARVRNNLGHDLLDEGDLDGAEIEMRVSLSLAPDYYPPTSGLAKIAHRRGNYAEALTWIERGMELRPASVEMYALEGDTRVRLGDTGGAARAWRAILEIDPDNASALSNLAILAWGQGRHDDALALWVRATDVPDASAGAWLNLARAYEELGQTRDAADAYRRILQSGSSDDSTRAIAERRLRALEGSP